MINSLLKLHKSTAIFRQGGGSNVDVILKPNLSHPGYEVAGLANFTGFEFVDGGAGFFGDTFELTINADDLFKVTDLKPVEGWIANVKLAMMNDEQADYYITNVAIDRTLGMYLLKCSATAPEDKGCKVRRNNAGGI